MTMEERLLGQVRERVLRYYPNQIRSCLEILSDEQLWWRPNQGANSVGTLIMHLCGSLRHFVGYRVGGLEFERHREAEFSGELGLSRAEVVARLDGTLSQLAQVLDGLRPEDLHKPNPERPEDVVGLMLARQTEHLALHTGQIIWIAKWAVQSPFRELWQQP